MGHVPESHVTAQIKHKGITFQYKAWLRSLKKIGQLMRISVLLVFFELPIRRQCLDAYALADSVTRAFTAHKREKWV